MRRPPPVPAIPDAGGVEAASRIAALRSREVAVLRDRLRRMLDDPETAEAMARAMKAMLRKD